FNAMVARSNRARPTIKVQTNQPVSKDLQLVFLCLKFGYARSTRLIFQRSALSFYAVGIQYDRHCFFPGKSLHSCIISLCHSKLLSMIIVKVGINQNQLEQ
ncbi:MAG: hypothetical protein ACXWF8_17525, partial [Methylobacter sp.]